MKKYLYKLIALLGLAAAQPALYAVSGTANLVLGQPNFTTTSSEDTFGYPSEVIVTSDRVYAVDYTNNRVLWWNNPASLANNAAPDGIIGQTSMSGKLPGTAADKLNQPQGVFVDPSGNVWISDSSNNRVLRFAKPTTNGESANLVLGQTNMTSNASATSATGMSMPIMTTMDSAGNVWVAEGSNHRIVKFSSTTIAGGWTPGSALSASLVIGQPNFTTNTNSPVTAASLNNPTAIAFDASGNMYVSDTQNNRSVGYTAPFSNGQSATMLFGQTSFTNWSAGAVSATSENGPLYLAIDPAGDLWVTDGGYNRVIKYPAASLVAGVGKTATAVIGQPNLNTSAVASPPNASSLNVPYVASFDSSGSMWVSDGSNTRVLRFPGTLTYTVSGTVQTSTGGILAGVTVPVTSSTASYSATTNASGVFSISLAGGYAYTVSSPAVSGFGLSPNAYSIANLSANISTYTFTATLAGYTASGTAPAGTTVTVSGGTSTAAVVGVSGSYSFVLSPGGSYTLTPALVGYHFSPVNASTAALAANWVNNFTATADTFTVSGTVSLSGSPFPGVHISVAGSTTTAAVTDGSGCSQKIVC